MADQATLLARGSWAPDQVRSVWREERWQPPAETDRLADEAIAALRDRGSPAHDGEAARLIEWKATGDGLRLELQPVRWALRLVDAGDSNSLTALTVVRREDGCWLAGRRASWLATWPNRWALGAAGSVDVGEDPPAALSRELHEEWQLTPRTLTVEALATMRSGLIAVVGLATVHAGAEPVPDAEHDEFAWWPADVGRWPDEADPDLRRVALVLQAAG